MNETKKTVSSRNLGVQAIGLVVSILICFAAAGLGGLVTTPQIPNWYADLAKPTWTPPDWIFGPVWSLPFRFDCTLSASLARRKVLAAIPALPESYRAILAG